MYGFDRCMDNMHNCMGINFEIGSYPNSDCIKLAISGNTCRSLLNKSNQWINCNNQFHNFFHVHFAFRYLEEHISLLKEIMDIFSIKDEEVKSNI